jgi:anti-sigma B factor antagonist
VPFPASDIEVRVRVARLDRAHVVSVTGELDLHGAAALRDALAPLVAGSDGDVIVDLDAIAFMDSTALGVLVAATKRLRRQGRELVVATDDPRLRRLLEITGLLRMLAHERTLADAVVRVGDHAA